MSLGFTLLGAFAAHWPTESVLGPLARILDALSPYFFLAGLVFGGLTMLFGGRLVGIGLSFVAAVFGAALFLSYRSVTVPVFAEQAPNLRVLFFNAEAENVVSSDRIVSRALEFDPDIIVFAEASAVTPSLDRLAGTHDILSACSAEECDLLVASALKERRFWQLDLNSVWPGRYAVFEFETRDGASAFLAASHLVKPWMSGISEAEIARLEAQYIWFKAPVVAVGDFNMSPWSLPMRRLLDRTGFRAVRGQPASWPVAAGRLGLPIDQVLVRDGVRVTAVTAFGRELGSNHLGFVADIWIPPG